MVKNLNPYDLKDKRTIWFLGRLSVASKREMTDNRMYSGGTDEQSKARVSKFSEIVDDIIEGKPQDEINQLLDFNTQDISIENARANPDLDVEAAYFQTGEPVMMAGDDAGWELLSEAFKQATEAVLDDKFGIPDKNRYFDIHALKPVKTLSQEDAYEVTFAPNYNLNYDKFGRIDDTENFQTTYVTGEVGDKFLRQNMKNLRIRPEHQTKILNMIHDGGIPNTPDALTALRMMDESHRTVSDAGVSFEAWLDDDLNSGNLALDMDIVAHSSATGDFANSDDDLSKKFDNSISGLSGTILEKSVGKSETEYIVNLDTVDFDVNLTFGAERNMLLRKFLAEAEDGLAIGEDVLAHNKAKAITNPTGVKPKHQSKLESLKAWGASLLE